LFRLLVLVLLVLVLVLLVLVLALVLVLFTYPSTSASSSIGLMLRSALTKATKSASSDFSLATSTAVISGLSCRIFRLNRGCTRFAFSSSSMSWSYSTLNTMKKPCGSICVAVMAVKGTFQV
jgi:hypothetical protein